MMKKRLLDLFLASAGAMFLLLLGQAVISHAAFITYPKSWIVGEILTSGDLNAQFAAISAQTNGNLDDTNLSGAANINGSKLASAPAGITTTKINDLAVTTGKIAVGATVNAIVTAIAVTNITITPGSGETTVVTLPAITTRGGRVLITGAIAWTDVLSTGSTATARFKRDGILILQMDYGFATGSSGLQVPVPTPSYVDTPPAGAHVYTVTMQVAGVASQVTTPVSNMGFMDAMEFS